MVFGNDSKQSYLRQLAIGQSFLTSALLLQILFLNSKNCVKKISPIKSVQQKKIAAILIFF